MPGKMYYFNIKYRKKVIMKSLMKKIEIFCYKHPRFGIPNLMLLVVIGNAIVWLFSMMDTSGMLLSLLAFSPSMILKGQVWRLITFALIPNTTGIWALIFIYFYYFIGNTLEKQWGTAKFTIYFFTGIILTIIYGFVVYFITKQDVYITATYIYFSMFFSFATLFPDVQVLLFFIIPVKIKWLAYVDAAFFVMEIIQQSFPINLLPVVALLNYFIFCGDILFSFIGRSSRKRSNVVNFKKEARRINHEQNSSVYNRKCAVCGRTDVDYPNLEFRFCSQCAGYHCFCEDHINNHIHFTE